MVIRLSHRAHDLGQLCVEWTEIEAPAAEREEIAL